MVWQNAGSTEKQQIAISHSFGLTFSNEQKFFISLMGESRPVGSVDKANLAGLTRRTTTPLLVYKFKGLSFGFSDYVTVYLNNKALYYGSDNFMSRDYRFLAPINFRYRK